MTNSMPVMLRRARATYGSTIRDALIQAGYDDVPQNGLYVFGSLDPDGKSLPLGDLIAGLGLTKQAGGQLVDLLVLRGYLDRQPDPHDRRRLTVALTKRGMAAAKVQLVKRQQIDDSLAAAIGPAAFGALHTALTALIEIGGRAGGSNR